MLRTLRCLRIMKFWYFGTFPACAHLRGRASAWSSAGGQTPPRGEEGRKPRKVLRKPLILPHFWKSQIFAFKQRFPLLVEPLFCLSKGARQELLRDRPEPVEGGSGGSTTTIPGRGRGGWGGLIRWDELKPRLLIMLRTLRCLRIM